VRKVARLKSNCIDPLCQLTKGNTLVAHVDCKAPLADRPLQWAGDPMKAMSEQL
jgi:hypothetical protein